MAPRTTSACRSTPAKPNRPSRHALRSFAAIVLVPSKLGSLAHGIQGRSSGREAAVASNNPSAWAGAMGSSTNLSVSSGTRSTAMRAVWAITDNLPSVAGSRPHHRLRDRSVECELKFRVDGPRDHARLRSLLRKRGSKLEGKYDEENYRFRGPGKSTRRTTLRLRVLNGGPHGVLTAKGPARFVGGVKIREETEIDVKDVHATLDLLSQLGFQVQFTYYNHRAMWTLDGVVSVTLDTLEIGSFIELEGPLEVLPEKARSLDFDPKDALKDSYSVFARKHLAAANKYYGP